jgi:23S rRNA-intervening sequence protein
MEVTVDHQKDLIRSYRDLRVWQEAMDLAEACYRTTRDFPKEELYGITSQIRYEATGKMLRALIRSLQKKGVGNSE